MVVFDWSAWLCGCLSVWIWSVWVNMYIGLFLSGCHWLVCVAMWLPFSLDLECASQCVHWFAYSLTVAHPALETVTLLHWCQPWLVDIMWDQWPSMANFPVPNSLRLNDRLACSQPALVAVCNDQRVHVQSTVSGVSVYQQISIAVYEGLNWPVLFLFIACQSKK